MEQADIWRSLLWSRDAFYAFQSNILWLKSISIRQFKNIKQPSLMSLCLSYLTFNFRVMPTYLYIESNHIPSHLLTHCWESSVCFSGSHGILLSGLPMCAPGLMLSSLDTEACMNLLKCQIKSIFYSNLSSDFLFHSKWKTIKVHPKR